MTTHRTYSCNLCRESMLNREDGIGIHFSTQDESGRFQPNIRFHERHLHDCENHLCKKCLQAIGLLLERKSVHLIA